MQTGLFGKLPAHGDFIARGVSVPLRKALDHWVTVHIGQRELPKGGLRARLVLGGDPVLAMILQSNDKSGRVFPIVAVTQYSNQMTADEWCQEAAAILERAIKQGQDAQATMQQLPLAPMAGPDQEFPFDAIWRDEHVPVPIAEALSLLNSD